ncbi:alkaline phytoceramidase [Cubamyces sp. BRFM 1775]|nr:alkaline phytoceramidase [Cubamyces sp. BRFM 1775]
MEPDSLLSPSRLSFLSSLSLPSLPKTTAQHSYPHMAAFANVTAGAFLSSRAFWGPVTATLDWCEANYQFSRYIAEAANTFSNLFTVALAVYGSWQSVSENLPARYLAGWMGFALVGIGSFIFHATLLFEAQLMDELPMVYVASYCCAILFDTSQGFSFRDSNALQLSIIFIAFNALFTWSYYLSRDPVYHQVVFATIMFTTLFRTLYLLRNGDIAKRLPVGPRSAVTRLFLTGAGTFASGFLIWNLDNVFCSKVTQWKNSIGWPAAFVLEGKYIRHLFRRRATGTYLMLVGNTCMTLCIKDEHANYAVKKFLGIPRLVRVQKVKSQ